jgi:hypothetical protein
MNRKFRQAVWLAFLAWAALELVTSGAKFRPASCPALPPWIDFGFFALAAAVILFEAAAHVGWRTGWLAFAIVGVTSGGACWLAARRFGPEITPMLGPMIGGLPLALPLLWWAMIGGLYLLYHCLLPLFDARVVALLTGVSSLVLYALLEPFASQHKFYWLWPGGKAPWLAYFGWLLLAFGLARLAPLKGDSKPAGWRRPLTVIAALAAVFVSGRLC